MSDLARVSQVDYENGAVKVTLPERGNIETNWLPMGSEEYEMPKVRDLVRVSLDEDKYTSGYCHGRYYNKENPPEDGKTGAEKYYKKLLGDLVVEYNSSTKTLTLTAKIINIKADAISIEGDVSITGDLTVSGSVTADTVNAATVNAGTVNEGG